MHQGTILGISGKMGSGKDTLADLLVERSDGRWVKDSFARAVRDELRSIYRIVYQVPRADAPEVITDRMDVSNTAAYQIVELVAQDHGQDAERLRKTPLYRTVMQTWATGIRRAQNPNYWVEQAFHNVHSTLQQGISVVFADVRFVNEALAILETGGTAIRLDIPEAVQLARLTARDGAPPPQGSLTHESETALDGFTQFSQVYNTARHTPEDILQQLDWKVG